jgi:hypothetical protein
LHSVYLCNHKFVKLDLQNKFEDQLDEDIKKHSDCIRSYFEKLKAYFLQQSPTNLVDTYKSQINLAIIAAESSRPAASKPASQLLLRTTQKAATQLTKTTQKAAPSSELVFNHLYQCLLGTYEALMEHFFMIGSYKYLYAVYESF